MTTMLKKAFLAVEKLPENKQNEFASFILAEISSDYKWNSLFKKSQKQLSCLAEEALAEYKEGKTTQLDIHSL